MQHHYLQTNGVRLHYVTQDDRSRKAIRFMVLL